MESELAGLGQADRELFLADMGVSDEECGLQVCQYYETALLASKSLQATESFQTYDKTLESVCYA